MSGLEQVLVEQFRRLQKILVLFFWVSICSLFAESKTRLMGNMSHKKTENIDRFFCFPTQHEFLSLLS